MYIPGHLAIGFLAASGNALAHKRPLDFRHELYPVLIGSLTPDIIDKSIKLFGISPFGRTIGHSLLTLVLLTLIWKFLSLRSNKHHPILGWWIIGFGLHLATDFFDDIIDGLFFTGYLFTASFTWPYLNPDMFAFRTIPLFTNCAKCTTPAEYGTVALAICVALVLHQRFSFSAPNSNKSSAKKPQ